MADKKIVIGLEVNSSAAQKNLEDLRDAAVKFGTDGAKHAEPLARSLENAEKLFGQLEKKISETGSITERDIGKAVRQVETFKTNLEKAFGSVANAPKAAQDALAGFEAKLTSASTAAGKLNNAVRDNEANVKAAAGQWTGLGGAMESMGGKTGKTVGIIALVVAALKEGWDIGKKIAEFFGTDFTQFDETIKTFGSRTLVVIKGIGSSVSNLYTLVADGAKNIFAGEFSKALGVVENFATVSEKTMKDIGHALTDGNIQWNRYAATIGVATDQSREEAAQTKKLADAKADLHKQIGIVTKAVENESAAIQKQTEASVNAGAVIAHRTADMDHFAREVKRTTDELNEQSKAVDAEAQAHGDNDPMTLQAIDRQKSLEQALKRSNEQYDAAHDDVEKYKKKQAEANAAIEEAKKKLTELTAELKKQQTELNSLTLDTIASATSKLAASAAAAAPATAALTGHLEKTAAQGPAAAAALEAAATATHNVATATAAVAVAISGADSVAQTNALATAMNGLATAMDRVKNSTEGAAAALLKFGEAAEKAAGSEGGGESGGGGGGGT